MAEEEVAYDKIADIRGRLERVRILNECSVANQDGFTRTRPAQGPPFKIWDRPADAVRDTMDEIDAEVKYVKGIIDYLRREIENNENYLKRLQSRKDNMDAEFRRIVD